MSAQIPTQPERQKVRLRGGTGRTRTNRHRLISKPAARVRIQCDGGRQARSCPSGGSDGLRGPFHRCRGGSFRGHGETDPTGLRKRVRQQQSSLSERERNGVVGPLRRRQKRRHLISPGVASPHVVRYFFDDRVTPRGREREIHGVGAHPGLRHGDGGPRTVGAN